MCKNESAKYPTDQYFRLLAAVRALARPCDRLGPGLAARSEVEIRPPDDFLESSDPLDFPPAGLDPD